jgi:large conductance mechanosensitive channel
MSGITKATQTVASVAGADESAAVTKAMDMSNWIIPGTSINVGNFISSIINFLIMALIIFCMVKAVNKLRTTLSPEEEAKEEAPAGPTQEELLAQIRDLLQEKNS